MRTIRLRREERGVALLLTIFGLLLMTAMVTAMLFSSDSETRIASNYRDKESAIYAAMSGVQEARDRLQPLNGDLSGWLTPAGPGPTALPTKNNGQILYIINPQNGETVAPWKTTNAYFDKELCQEQSLTTGTPPLFATAGAVGVACTTAPTGNAWYAVYDESANATNWKLKDAGGTAIPLDYKWTRIQLKADNSAPVYVQTTATPANGTQLCWDTVSDQQLQLPAGAGTNCLGSVTGSPVQSLTLQTDGAGYSLLVNPTVSITGGGGSGAKATATTTPIAGGIISGALTNFGSGYTSAPTVALVSPDGSGATLTALVGGSAITKLALNTTNYCYASGTTGLSVSFSPSPSATGSDATASVAMTPGTACVATFSASGKCASQKGNTIAVTSVPGATGSGFSGSVTFDAAGKASGSITNVGSYTSVPAGSSSITVAAGCSITASFTGGTQISSLNLTSGGAYISAPTASITGGLASAPTSANPTIAVTWAAGANNGKLTAIQVSKAGTGYLKPTYTLSFTGGGGTGAVGTATSGASAKVTGLTLTNGGNNYTTTPTVTICDPTLLPANCGPGSGATATATLQGGSQRMLGQVYLLTSMAVTRSGSQAMVQMEAGVPPPTKFQLGGALTLQGNAPSFSTPNAANFVVSGNDANSCGEAQMSPLPAIGVANSTAESSVISALGKPNNYIGQQSAPDVQVTNAANPTPEELTEVVNTIATTPGAVVVPSTFTGICTSSCPSYTALPGATTKNSVTVVNGNLTLSGAVSGNGILVVTGNLTLSGNFSWNGLVLVLGSATSTNNGGGNGQIIGAMYVGSTNTGGSANFLWNGGGGNGIQYDHCWADDLLNNIKPLASPNPLQVLSTRLLEF